MGRPRRLTGEQLEPVVPCASFAADLDPGDTDRLELAGALDTADVDHVGPAEARQYIADDALGAFVVSGDQHRRLTLAEARLDEVLVADRVERLDHPRLGQCMLDALAERVLARDRKLRWEAAREIERIRGVNHDFAAEVGWAGGVDRVLAAVAEHRPHRGQVRFEVTGRSRRPLPPLPRAALLPPVRAVGPTRSAR